MIRCFYTKTINKNYTPMVFLRIRSIPLQSSLQSFQFGLEPGYHDAWTSKDTMGLNLLLKKIAINILL